jgi:tetratricopeptide (TPR) repeat protein
VRALALLLPALLAAASAPPARADASGLLDPASLADARAGLDHLYHARTAEAAAAFERIRARHPESPAADFLLGGIAWHELTTGPQGFAGGPDEEERFLSRMRAAIERGERAVERDPGDVSARFFLGGSYGYQARFLALRERWWDAYRTGRRGLKHLERVAKDAPGLDDAYLGLGIYHYYADVVPAVLKVLAGIVGLGGDRERGLSEIRRALRGGALVDVEAAFFLAEISTTFEEDHWTALALARALRDRFPENELFTWLHARVLDDLHLADRAALEWRALRAAPRSASVRGFLDYRIARSRLGGGDFQGAARDLAELLAGGRLGSRRITMWARLRLGLALDVLGRHEEAIAQYRLAKELDASDPAAERAAARLDAGRRDPRVVSLAELEEAAGIVRASPLHGEDAIRRLEAQVTGPSRGHTEREARTRFRILGDLAAARLVRGDAEGCRAAIERALEGTIRPPRESRADLLALRARVHARAGRLRAAEEDLREARSLSAGRARDALEAERAHVARMTRLGREGPATGGGDFVVRFDVPDRAELAMQVEGDFLPAGRRLDLRLAHGRWSGEVRVPAPAPVRYRLVADGAAPRPDVAATRVVLQGDVFWCVRAPDGAAAPPQPKQTKPSPSR